MMKWNTINNSSLETQSVQSSELTLSFSTAFSPFSLPTNSTLHHPPNQPLPLSLEKEKSWRYCHFWQSETYGMHEQCQMPLHNSNPNSYTKSITSDEASNKENYHTKFNELNAENLKILCNALERKVPWQKEIVPEIASAILKCRSGMKRRIEYCRVPSGIREDTWLLFRGRDNEGKENITREIASLIFGSQNYFVSLRLGAFSPTTRCTSIDNITNKRSRPESEHDHLEQLFHALHENPHRVVFIKDVDQLDYIGKMCLKRAIQDGLMRNVDGEETSFHDSIVVLSCDVFNTKERASSPQNKRKVNHEENETASEKEADSGFGLDLNLCVDDNSEECCFDDVGLLEAVDEVFFFNLQEGL
jgi:ATP-dependent Clp protease ATP-binding subunit ClpA